MTQEQLIDVLTGARAAIDSALDALGVVTGDYVCPHPADTTEALPTAMGEKEQNCRCATCGETFTRPWPDEETEG
ncbi:hypothetical protein LCGC14_2499710 [marine sediment metagenome]|uniref:Uncharacterized protein n=1 Tax=marine sediment metagenome TaxID=412755 RepID=A0A0F9BQA7_9ZZZZ